MKNLFLNKNRLGIRCICLAILVCGCSEDDSSESGCVKTEEICAARNQSFDADHCECIAKTCNMSAQICANEGKSFDETNCVCISKTCDKSEQTCANEGKSFNQANCECIPKTCDKTEQTCANEGKSFDETNCECFEDSCKLSPEICAERNKFFDIVNCECIDRICNKDENTCASDGKLFDEENCSCYGKLCDLTAESCAAKLKDFDKDNCECVDIQCSSEDACAAENKVFNPDTCLCDLVCDGVKDGHKLSPILDYLKYSEFGAAGDGKTDDQVAIKNTHVCANKYHLKVKADEGAVYYVGIITDEGAIVKTDTDWTGASFTLDDSNVGIDLRGKNLFNVRSDQKEQCLVGNSNNCPNELTTLSRHQENIGITFPQPSIVVVVNNNVKQYIREGLNQNDGTPQTDIIVVDRDGNVDMTAPIMWDYQEITSATFTPMDEETLTLKGGTFTTIANRAESEYNYYGRGINIQRSNVVVDGITHYVINELNHGAPYNGFITINNCANILIKNSIFTAHKIYKTIGSAGKSVSMGTYDLGPSKVIHLTFDNCKQTTDILDTSYWGIMGSNFCKDIIVKDSEFSRFDAHQGVANVTIINSKLGHQGLNAIGEGLLKIENSTIYGSSFINLRSDYGSTWHGNVEIKNSTWVPNQGNIFINADLINGSFSGEHDFGYECYMPETIDIDGLHVEDSMHLPLLYLGINLLANITPDNTNEEFENAMAYKYHVTKTINIRNFSSASLIKWKLSSNQFMYRDVVVNEL